MTLENETGSPTVRPLHHIGLHSCQRLRQMLMPTQSARGRLSFPYGNLLLYRLDQMEALIESHIAQSRYPGVHKVE